MALMKKIEKALALKILTHINTNLLSKLLSKKRKHSGKYKTQILIDISVFNQNDAGTGIQRVVRTIKKVIELNYINHQLMRDNFSIRFIYASRKKSYHYLDNNKKISVEKGDIFFGLDWSAHILTSNFNEIINLKYSGVFFSFILYDMLPATNPEWFTKETVQKHSLWLKLISITADQILCISNDVKDNLLKHYDNHLFNHDHIDICTIPLGCDFENYPSEVKFHQNCQLEFIKKPFALVVGTLEPRKGHIDVIEVFKQLWQEKYELNLIFVGHNGWSNNKILELIKTTISEFPENFKHLENVNDLELKIIYESAKIVICPSLGEGYGLPVIEAMYFNKCIIARNIPVFREVSNNQINFFTSNDELKNELSNLNLYDFTTQNYHRISWQYSTQIILKKIYAAAFKEGNKLEFFKLDNED